MSDSIPPAIKAELAEIRADHKELRASHEQTRSKVDRLELALAGAHDDIKEMRREQGERFDGLAERLDDAIGTTLRAIPPWAAAIGGVLIAILAAVAEARFRGGVG